MDRNTLLNDEFYRMSTIFSLLNMSEYGRTISELQEILQSKNMPVPHYEVVREIGPDHSKIYEMEVRIGDNRLGIGQGSSKQNAAKQAAQNALENLGYEIYGQEPDK